LPRLHELRPQAVNRLDAGRAIGAFGRHLAASQVAQQDFRIIVDAAFHHRHQDLLQGLALDHGQPRPRLRRRGIGEVGPAVPRPGPATHRHTQPQQFIPDPAGGGQCGIADGHAEHPSGRSAWKPAAHDEFVGVERLVDDEIVRTGAPGGHGEISHLGLQKGGHRLDLGWLAGLAGRDPQLHDAIVQGQCADLGAVRPLELLPAPVGTVRFVELGGGVADDVALDLPDPRPPKQFQNERLHRTRRIVFEETE